MIFVYLDEFGHNGPFFGRRHQKYSESPVFGLAGIILPEVAVRPFATFFLKRKEELLDFDIKKSGKEAFEWEKKGTNLLTTKSIIKYPEIRRALFRILNRIRDDGGHVFYYGREKLFCRNDLRANGLYTTCMAYSIRALERYAASRGENFVIVIDEHSARKELLETAYKTMYGSTPAVHLASPPFEVESYLNQNAQAADWIATLIGRLSAYSILPDEYADLKPYRDYFGSRIDKVSTHSSLFRRDKISYAEKMASLAAEIPHDGVHVLTTVTTTVEKTTVVENVTLLPSD